MRVFNISLHKTATESVACALGLLGFHSRKWPALFQPFIEGRLQECLKLLTDNIALSDLPTTFMYMRLYELFPDAKFILVRRELEDWLDSLKRHLRRYPSPQPTHTFLYGYPISRDNFREDVCRRTWHRHHEDAEKFFEGNPNFLSLPIAELEWEPLCAFLGRDIPILTFPYINVDSPSGRREPGFPHRRPNAS
jgi:hypothetical protein